MTYVIRGGVEGRERLRLLSEVVAPSTRAFLAEVGVPAGASCLDVGCGGGDVTRELARAAGAGGRALGVDLDAVKVEIARREAAEQGIANVAFGAHDVRGWAPEESFDVVYARFLLTHLSDPLSLLAALRRHVRPGGVLAVEDIDFRGHFSEPDCPALHRYVEVYSESVRRRGADPNIGPRLPALLREAGFRDVRMRLVHPAGSETRLKLLAAVTLENIAEAVLADRLIGEDELAAAVGELHAFAREPHTILGGPRIFQVWGRA
jgi:2-polyprenyl-3-methyl-5-hydroxy-6-metoxy-1,4-benzoquinol methylase